MHSSTIAKFTELCHKPLCEGHIFSSVPCRQWYACLKLLALGVPLPPRDMIPLMQHNPAVLTHVLHKQFLSLRAHPHTSLRGWNEINIYSPLRSTLESDHLLDDEYSPYFICHRCEFFIWMSLGTCYLMDFSSPREYLIHIYHVPEWWILHLDFWEVWQICQTTSTCGQATPYGLCSCGCSIKKHTK